MGEVIRQKNMHAFKMSARCGWHRHHLLPNHLRRYPDLRKFMERLGRTGAGLGDFETNGMFLPSEERIAQNAHLPLHRGPHLAYNDVVVGALDSLRQEIIRHEVGERDQHASVRNLQRRLKTLLQLSALDMDVALAGRDPFGPIPVAAALDRQTDALFAAALARTQDQAASA